MTFQGFDQPQSNYSKLPHEFIWMLPDFTCHAELAAVIYTLRHTWGYGEFGQLKRITLDEYENGRKRADGTRIDRGCGVKAAAVRRGLMRAVEHGFLIHEQDASDPGRVENFYGLNLKPSIQGDHYDHPTHQSDPPKRNQGDHNDHPGRSKRSPEQRKKTLKETNFGKETEKQEADRAPADAPAAAPKSARSTVMKLYPNRKPTSRRTFQAPPSAVPALSPGSARPLSQNAAPEPKDASPLPQMQHFLAQANDVAKSPELTTEAVRLDIYQDRYWLAFKRRWYEKTETDLAVPVRWEKQFKFCAAQLQAKGATEAQVERVVDRVLAEGQFTFRFDWVIDRIDAILSEDGAKKTAGGMLSANIPVGYEFPSEAKKPEVAPNARVLNVLPGTRGLTAADAWNTAFQQCQMQMDRTTFETWVRGAVLVDYAPDQLCFTVCVPTAPARDMLQQRLVRLVRRILSDVSGIAVELKFMVEQDWKVQPVAVVGV